jgi:hypothetical protein
LIWHERQFNILIMKDVDQYSSETEIILFTILNWMTLIELNDSIDACANMHLLILTKVKSIKTNSKIEELICQQFSRKLYL